MRANRRYRNRVARFRHQRILEAHWRRYWTFTDLSIPRKTHQLLPRLCMTTPNWWDHLHSIEPARFKTSTYLRSIQRGADPDGILWPDYRRPQTYYW